MKTVQSATILPIFSICNRMLVSNLRTLPIGSSPCVAVAVPWVVCLELSKRIPWSIWNLAQSVSTVTWESMRSYWQVYTSYAAMCSSKIVLLHQDLRRILSKRLWRMMWNRIEVIAVPSRPKSSSVFKRVSLKFKPTSFFSSFSSYTHGRRDKSWSFHIQHSLAGGSPPSRWRPGVFCVLVVGSPLVVGLNQPHTDMLTTCSEPLNWYDQAIDKVNMIIVTDKSFEDMFETTC